MIVEFDRILPDRIVKVGVNTDYVVWVQAHFDGNGTTIYMEAGEPLEVEQDYGTVKSEVGNG